MKHIKLFLMVGLLVATLVAPLTTSGTAQAASLAGENFTGISTPSNAWVSGGSGGSVACLTAATTSATNSIPACSGGPLDSVGSGLLRLTPTTNSRAGFAIYNTPVSTTDGLQVSFDMYQYGGTGADGISFFLIDGATSPTQPGAYGGSLGYSSNTGGDPGLVGGYVGVGFDRFGNFSHPDFGTGGTGRYANSITVRGSAGTGYPYVTRASAAQSLSSTTRANSKLQVKVKVSTNNIMSVAINYGSGYVTALSNINLNTINGAGSLPATFKLGFAASTGGSNNTHEIGGLSVNTNPPSVGIDLSHSGSFVQGSNASYTIAVNNDSAAEATDGLITVAQTLPAGITPTAATGTGWACNITGQNISCTRPGDGANKLAGGASAPNITVTAAVASNASTPLSSSATVTTPGNDSSATTDTDSATVLTGSYQDTDGIYNAVELAGPNSGDSNNDGTTDNLQSKVTSLPNPVTGSYAVLETSGCSSTNGNVSVASASSNSTTDGDYAYPVGMMDFRITCTTPGGTANVNQYYFGSYDASKYVVRKYDATTHLYQTISDATITNVTIGGQPAIKVSYPITDGSSLDSDGLANGIIVDPAGPALKNQVIAAATAATIPAVPDTGLAAQSTARYYIAGLVGITILLLNIRYANKVRRQTSH